MIIRKLTEIVFASHMLALTACICIYVLEKLQETNSLHHLHVWQNIQFEELLFDINLRTSCNQDFVCNFRDFSAGV
jgi:hypothetical protein